jgi:hypothetical protein
MSEFPTDLHRALSNKRGGPRPPDSIITKLGPGEYTVKCQRCGWEMTEVFSAIKAKGWAKTHRATHEDHVHEWAGDPTRGTTPQCSICGASR